MSEQPTQHSKNIVLIMYGFGFGAGIVGLIDHLFWTSSILNTVQIIGAGLMLVGGVWGVMRYSKKYSEGTW